MFSSSDGLSRGLFQKPSDEPCEIAQRIASSDFFKSFGISVALSISILQTRQIVLQDSLSEIGFLRDFFDGGDSGDRSAIFGRGRKERKPSGKPSSKRELGFDGSSANPSSIQLLPRVLSLVPLGLKSSLMNFSQPSIRLSPLTRSR